jgi:8-amino-7-oxononanoate synthase
MFQIQKIPSRTVQTEKGKYFWFGGTSYLGMPHNTHFQELVKFGLENYGANWGSSRNNPLRLSIYEKAENFLANFGKAPSALTVSSGMLAGQMVLKYLESKFPNALIIYTPRVHPALWGSNYVQNPISFNEFIEKINSQIIEYQSDTITIVADSVSSPHFEKYDFNWVQNLPKNKQINLVIDDSHSLGLMNENGEGVYSTIKHNDNVNLVVVASLNKALGVPAGVIFGKKELRNEISQTAFFSGCSPMSPAFGYACANGEEIYKNALFELRKNIKYFKSSLEKSIEVGNLEGHPAFCFEKEGLHEYLKKKNILIPSFGYPNPSDKPITRLIISSLHSKEDLNLLSNCVNEFYKN